MAGTNPDQGAALARATAEALATRPVLAIITTHYDSLKALGESDARFANGGMEYDLAHLRPTFRLSVGSPGRSYAFDIAARIGLPAVAAGTGARAGGALPAWGSSRPSRGWSRGRRSWPARRSGLPRRQPRPSTTAEAQQAAAAALERRERELGRKAAEAVEAAVADTRAALRAIVRQAQEAGTARAAEAGRAEVARVAAEALARLRPAARRPRRRRRVSLSAGTPVFVERLGRRGRGVTAAGRARPRQGHRRGDDDRRAASRS